MAMSLRFQADRARFEANVDKNGPVPTHRPGLGPCHLWTARRNHKGYGACQFRGKQELAHRVGFFLAHGRWPEPFALHHCDNPPCVNDAHLFEGTNADNVADRGTKGRNGAARGRDNGRAKLTAPDVRDIRANYALCRVTQMELALRFGVNHRTINVIVLGKRWTHV
jgi:hypothetical protein